MSAPDYEAQLHDSLPEIGDIEDDDLRERVVNAWLLGLNRGGWRHIEDIPYAHNIQEVSNVEHLRGVTEIAVASAHLQREIHGADPDMDVVRAGCLLHDVGKCYEKVAYVDESHVDPDPTYTGTTIPHSLSGYALAHEVGCPIEVQQTIPHAFAEIPERSLEAELVKNANDMSSNAIMHTAMGLTLTEWATKHSTLGSHSSNAN